MTTDKTIFGLRFKSNPDLLPPQAYLTRFLNSSKRAGIGLYRDDLEPYRELLADLKTFEQHRQAGTAQPAFEERLLYGVLTHSHIIQPALLLAVEQYQYHLHALAILDFKKPSAFIKSAEIEMGRLNPKKREDAARLRRFEDMIDERKRLLATLEAHWAALVEELGHIVQYIRDNLSKIVKLCEASIAVLVSEQIDRKKELGLIEDIKAHIKERLKESLRQGRITPGELEAAKEELADLSRRTADLIRSDVYNLTGLYEAIQEHTKNIMQELDSLSAQFAVRRSNIDADRIQLAKIETILTALLTGCRLNQRFQEKSNDTEHDKIVLGKRKEMIDHLFDLLQRVPVS